MASAQVAFPVWLAVMVHVPTPTDETVPWLAVHAPAGAAAKVATVSSRLASALSYAHGRGIIHRDVKPENVLLQGGHALVADFGIALAVQQAGGARMTQTGLSLGTPKVPWSPAPTEHSLTAGLPACADSIVRRSLTPGA